jgi:hypothetical protein
MAHTHDLVAGAQIVGMSVMAAVVYGVLHDQVTARVCVEYFTVGHPPVFDTNDPTLLGLGWGVIATWWVGLLLGAPLAIVARAGPWPELPSSTFCRPIGVLLPCMAASAALAGVLGFAAARANAVFLVEPLANRVPAERHAAFVADLWAHTASYGSGIVGGAVVIAWAWRRRYLAAVAQHQAAGGERPHALRPGWVRPALRLAAQVVVVPQLGLVYVSALFAFAPLAGTKPLGLVTVLFVRLLSGLLAVAALALAVVAWKQLAPVLRIATALVSVPAMLLVLVCLANVLSSLR